MLNKLMLLRCKCHTHFLSPPNLFPPKLILTSPAIFSLLHTKTHSLSISYGPSLKNGTPFTPHETLISNNEHEIPPFDEAQFNRVFEISALRVPSQVCYDLESRLRGHLLNWPRIPNIARVFGDEIDDNFKNMLAIEGEKIIDDEDENEVEKLVSRRVYGRAEGDGEDLSGVLYREKLAKEFNARGFVKFRNLAKISRPNKNKSKMNKRRVKGGDSEGESEGEEERGGKRRSVLVEVVEERENDDLSGLLGEDVKGRKWRGSTRLLLLDERYARRNVEELPEAVKAVLNEGSSEVTKSNFELVRCNLTLFYDYWPMNEVLEALLPEDMIVPSAFETVGHIAHLNLRDEHLPYKKLIAKVVLDKNRPKIRTVVNKVEAISNDYRTMQLEVLAGNHSLVTTIIENGIRFQLDLATVYWNSRLATERQRLLSCFTSDDVLCDVFSGVGPLAIFAAKKVKRVYANDLNPYAVDYLERNSVLNKLERKIEVFNMDGRRFIDLIFSNDKAHPVTQVVMNLPNNAEQFLDAFRGVFRDKPKDRKLTLPRIHVYGFSKADDPEFDFHERIRVALAEAAVAVEMRRVRMVAPGKWMLCASFVLPEKVALCKNYVDCR